MYFLERREYGRKTIKGAAGLANSKCVMGIHSYHWKAVAVCEERKPLEDMLVNLDKTNYRIISNNPPDEES